MVSKKYFVVWTEPVLSDLNEIAEYIALDKLSAAKQLVKKVFTSVERLEEFPESGRVPLELEDSNYREIICDPCRLFYRVSSNNVYIVYVMRSERKMRKYILENRNPD